MGSSPVTPTKKLCECKGTRIFIYNRNLCEVRTVEMYIKRQRNSAEFLELV